MALRAASRRGTASTFVIVGLANPGTEYEGSRHNVGGDAVRLLASRFNTSLSLESRQRCVSGSFATTVGVITVAVPTTYMNESGAALPPLLTRTSLTDFTHLIVAHDELDLEPGRLQIKVGGGLAGHNGLRSIAGVLGTQEFTRLRIGIGKPATKEQGANWVLRPPRGVAREELQETVVRAADALELFFTLAPHEVQSRVNAS